MKNYNLIRSLFLILFIVTSASGFSIAGADDPVEHGQDIIESWYGGKNGAVYKEAFKAISALRDDGKSYVDVTTMAHKNANQPLVVLKLMEKRLTGKANAGIRGKIQKVIASESKNPKMTYVPVPPTSSELLAASQQSDGFTSEGYVRVPPCMDESLDQPKRSLGRRLLDTFKGKKETEAEVME